MHEEAGNAVKKLGVINIYLSRYQLPLKKLGRTCHGMTHLRYSAGWRANQPDLSRELCGSTVATQTSQDDTETGDVLLTLCAYLVWCPRAPMRHGTLPRVQGLTSGAWLCSTLVTAILACGQCRVCGVDGLSSAGSLNVTFARNSRNSRVCTDTKGSIATAGAGIDVMAPVPYFYPVDATGTPLPGEC